MTVRPDPLDATQQALAELPDLVVISDPTGRLIYANPAAAEMIGVPVAELMAKDPRSFPIRLETLDGKLVPLEVFPLGRVLRDRQRVDREEYRLVRPDGTTLVISVSAAPFAGGGFMVSARDVSREKQAEEALRSSEEKYRMLVEASTDAIFLETTDFRILDCNSAALEMFGYSKGEMLRLTATDLIPPEDIPGLEGLSAEAFAAGGFRIEARNVRKDGSIFPVELNTRLFESGGQKFVIVFVRDLTEPKAAQATILERERFLADIFASIQDGISILDTELNILRVNPVMEKWYEHHLPLPGKKCFQAYHGADRACAVCPSIQAIRTGTAAMEISPKTGPGGIVTGWFDLYAFPIFDRGTGRIRGVIEYVRDVTARKLAEDALAAEKERLSVTLRSIGDGVITTDVEGRVILMNQVAEKLTGYRQEESLGRPLEQVFRIIHEFTREPVDSPVDQVIRTAGVAGLANHTLLVARDGTERAIADSGSPIRDRDSRIVGVVLVFRDVTQKRQAEEQMMKAEKLESLGILAGGIAHDFNNILTGILGNISLARLLPGDRAADRLVEAEKACQRARDLTQQLLTFSRGGMPVKTTASIGEIIAESARFALRGSRTSLELDLEPGLWPAEVDVGQISQVAQNLVINADQAMPAGGTIRVRARNFIRSAAGDDGPAVRPGNYVCFTVADEGEGIPPELLNKIFDPFFTTKEKGSGIGLTTSYSIVSKHDGYILVESAVGRGSKFSVFLPASPEKLPAWPRAEGKLERGSGRVLVMDDEEAIRELAALMLRELGYEPLAVESGEQALDQFRRARLEGRPFAAVILDLTVPGRMGGQETVARLREIDPAVKALVSSGYSTDPALSRYLDYGFAGFITKPYDVQTLGRTLRQLLSP